MNNKSDNNQYAHDSALGRGSEYVDRYRPELLHAIKRVDYRNTIADFCPAPYGYDLWQCYELSWLNPQGIPQVACASITVPLASPVIVESKSLKLYLNSLNSEHFASDAELVTRIKADLNALLEVPVLIELVSVSHGDSLAADQTNRLAINPESLLDTIDVVCEQYQRDASLLLLRTAGEQVSDQWHYSHLLRSHCPVTNQPDWGTVHIRYSGQVIEPASLLRYIVSYRQHCGFHEQCVEQIFSDIMQQCQPTELTVYAQYTRRGGVDINPLRSSVDKPFKVAREFRQ